MNNKVGPAAGTIIIVILLIAGGLYFFLSRENAEPVVLPPVNETL